MREEENRGILLEVCSLVPFPPYASPVRSAGYHASYFAKIHDSGNYSIKLHDYKCCSTFMLAQNRVRVCSLCAESKHSSGP